MTLHDALMLFAVVLAGLVRGATGFGGAMVMSPVLASLAGPVSAVVIALILETLAAAVTFPKAWHLAHWRTLGLLTLPAALTVPLGGYLLMASDPRLVRLAISLSVIFFAGILLLGFRYRGAPRAATSLALGGIVGVLLGATSVGAPPVILYLLSGPDPIAVTRANLTVFVTSISVIGLVMLALAGAITLPLALTALALALPYLASTWAGQLIAVGLSERALRRLALVLMIGIGLANVRL